MKKVLISLLMFALVFYALGVGALYMFQRSLMYFPNNSRPALPHNADLVEVISDGLELQAWYFAPQDASKPVILHFHGNGGNFANRLPKVQPYIDQGYGVLLAEYRGYGGNPGQPSEQGFYEDGVAYIEWLRIAAGYDFDQIILYGESIGSGVAMEMASRYKVQALILETPFASMVETAQAHYFYVPVFLLLKDRFQNIDKITKFHGPVLILHGHKDTVVPYKFGRKLYEKANSPKKFVDFPAANHNNLYEYGAAQDVLKFLEDL